MAVATRPPDRAIRGVCPVLEVPFTADEEVDRDGFSDVVAHVLGTGVTSVMFPGFASEHHKLSERERDDLTALLLEQTRERDDVAAVVSVPDHATLLACRRVEAALELGADAVNVLPPHQLAPSPTAVLAHVRAVLAAAAGRPVVLQYAPAQTGTTLTPQVVADLAREHPGLAYVKVESAMPGRFVDALRATGSHVQCLVGYGGLQLPDALRRGVAGVQPGCSFTELYVRLWALWEDGEHDAALALHARMLPYLSMWMQSVELIVAAEKLVSRERGLIGTAVCRRPAHELDGPERADVERFLREFSAELDPGRPR